MKKNNLLEEIAKKEHNQWSSWVEYMLNNLTSENIKRWKKQIKTEYEDLSEKEKESDKKWARKVINIINKYKMIE